MKAVARLAAIAVVVALVQSVGFDLKLVRAQEGKIVPYVPTPQEVVERMLDLAGVKKGAVLLIYSDWALPESEA